MSTETKDSKVINDGGPAFPVAGFVSPYDQQIDPWPTPGMSLRDWFAGMALVGMLAGHGFAFAKECYEKADGMLEERGK